MQEAAAPTELHVKATETIFLYFKFLSSALTSPVNSTQVNLTRWTPKTAVLQYLVFFIFTKDMSPNELN